MKEAKEILEEEVYTRRAVCSDSSTPKYKELLLRNEDVIKENKRRVSIRKGEEGYTTGRLRVFTPVRLFPFDKVEKEETKGGLNFLFITFEIY